MTFWFFQISFILTFFVSCGNIDDKAKQLGGKAKAKSKQLIDTAIRKVLSDQESDYFSIANIVTAFKEDKSIIEIKGIQIDKNFLYTEYCVYKGKKSNVLKAVNAIVPKKVNDYASDNKCYLITEATFYQDIAPYEKSRETVFFWNFEKLKSYEIYSCIKAPLRHYIIFDRNSDTVYHRIEELRD